MDGTTIIAIAALMAIAAALYSTVGHGGASAYLAIMALFSVAPETMRPTALALNLVVATFAAGRFALKGQTNWRMLSAFAVTAVPAAYIGGSIDLASTIYRPLVGAMLALAAVRLFWQPERLATRPVHALPGRNAANGRRAWPACRTDGHRRRHISQSLDHSLRLGRRAQDVRHCRRLHRAQFGGRSARESGECTAASR